MGGGGRVENGGGGERGGLRPIVLACTFGIVGAKNIKGATTAKIRKR